MKTRILRFLLPAILVAAGGGAVAWTWTLAQHLEHLEATGRQTGARIDRLEVLLDEMTQNELRYVASGETDADMLRSTSNLLRQIATDSSRLLAQLAAGAPFSATAVADAVETLEEVEGRARENMRAGLDLMAADLLFTETTRTRQMLREQLRALRLAESTAVADGRSKDVKRVWMALAGVALLFAFTLVLSSRGSTAPSASDLSPQLSERDLVPPHESEKADIAPSLESNALSLDLKETAALCTAISRIQADSDLHGLLARTAALLRAPGVVVWMAAGEEIFAVAGHGYDSRHLSQLGPIAYSSLNATAAAWRSGTLQTVPGESNARSAIAAPLLGVERCIGVLAIELASGRETDVATQAVATLIAAQFATVLGAWPAPSAIPPAEVLPFERASASTGI
jgi:hypothetical protein